jgi:hypothetical protein
MRAGAPFGGLAALTSTPARTAGNSSRDGPELPGNTCGGWFSPGTAHGPLRRALVQVTAADVSRPTDTEDPMTVSTSAPEQALIADLPATLAGLWTAITLTHGVADGLVAARDPGAPGGLAAVVEACAGAADSLAVSRSEALGPATDLPAPGVVDAAGALPLVSALASSCIDLAIDLLGNEAEPLSPVEVLAVTRAVTALCAARSLAQGCAA